MTKQFLLRYMTFCNHYRYLFISHVLLIKKSQKQLARKPCEKQDHRWVSEHQNVM